MKKTAYAMEAVAYLRKLTTANNGTQGALIATASKYIESVPKIYVERGNTPIFKMPQVQAFPADSYFANDALGVMLPFPSAWIAVEDPEGGIVGILARHLSRELLSAYVFVRPPAGEWIHLPLLYVFSIGEPAGKRRKEIKQLLPPALSRHPIFNKTFQLHRWHGILGFALSPAAASIESVVYDQAIHAFEDVYCLLSSLRQPRHALRPMEDSPESAYRLDILPEGISDAEALKEAVLYNWLCEEEAYEIVRRQEACVICGVKKGAVAGGAIQVNSLGVKAGYGVCGGCLLGADYYSKVLAGAKNISSRISSVRGRA